MRKIFYILIFAFIFCIIVQNQIYSFYSFNEAYGEAVADVVLTRASGALANFYNPALLVKSEANDIVLSFQNPYNVNNLFLLLGAFKYSLSSFAFGMAYSSIKAGNLYSDTYIGINASFEAMPLKRMHIYLGSGIKINERLISIKEERENRAVNPLIGLQVDYSTGIRQSIDFGAVAEYQSYEKELLYSFELSYNFENGYSVGVNADPAKQKYGIGLETKRFFKLVTFRGGLLINKPVDYVSLIYKTGIGLFFENFKLDFAYTIDTLLGTYETVSFIIIF